VISSPGMSWWTGPVTESERVELSRLESELKRAVALQREADRVHEEARRTVADIRRDLSVAAYRDRQRNTRGPADG
jgi:hypothetical protein